MWNSMSNKIFWQWIRAFNMSYTFPNGLCSCTTVYDNMRRATPMPMNLTFKEWARCKHFNLIAYEKNHAKMHQGQRSLWLRTQGSERRAQGTGLRAQGSERRAQGSEHRAQSSEHRTQSTGHRAWSMARKIKIRFHSSRQGDMGRWGQGEEDLETKRPKSDGQGAWKLKEIPISNFQCPKTFEVSGRWVFWKCNRQILHMFLQMQMKKIGNWSLNTRYWKLDIRNLPAAGRLEIPTFLPVSLSPCPFVCWIVAGCSFLAQDSWRMANREFCVFEAADKETSLSAKSAYVQKKK